MKEIGVAVVGYEGLYVVTNWGNVWACCKQKQTKRGPVWLGAKKMKPCKTGTGYPTLLLRKEGVSKTHYVHRLVAEAFLPNPNNLPCVNHKDESRDNNHVDNLEWCTYSYNCTYGTRIDRILKTKGLKPRL